MAAGKIHKLVQEFLKASATTPGFGQNLNKVKILSCDNGQCKAELTVEPDMCNQYGTLHGAFSSLLLDNLTSIALMTHPKSPSAGVSVDMYSQYLKGAPIGTTVLIEADSVRVGRTLAFLEMTIKEKETGVLLVKGAHTKFVAV